MKTILAAFFSCFLTLSAQANALTATARVAQKIATHSADNVAEHVVTHYGDDAARGAVKVGGEVAVHAAPKVARAVDAAVDAARLETTAAKPVVEAIHRTPIVKPMHLVGAGAGIAAIDAAHNLTAGERERDRALADATREILAEHPEQLVETVRAEGETGFWNHIGAGLGRAFVWFAAILGGLLGIAGLIHSLPVRRRRKPDSIDVSPKSAD